MKTLVTLIGISGILVSIGFMLLGILSGSLVVFVVWFGLLLVVIYLIHTARNVVKLRGDNRNMSVEESS